MINRSLFTKIQNLSYMNTSYGFNNIMENWYMQCIYGETEDLPSTIDEAEKIIFDEVMHNTFKDQGKRVLFNEPYYANKRVSKKFIKECIYHLIMKDEELVPYVAKELNW